MFLIVCPPYSYQWGSTQIKNASSPNCINKNRTLYCWAVVLQSFWFVILYLRDWNEIEFTSLWFTTFEPNWLLWLHTLSIFIVLWRSKDWSSRNGNRLDVVPYSLLNFLSTWCNMVHGQNHYSVISLLFCGLFLRKRQYAHTSPLLHSSCSCFLFSEEISAAGANQHRIQEQPFS